MKSQTKNASKRNGTISLVKFLAAILVMIYHGGRILIGKNHNFSSQTGYVLVDLFFIISGYYFYKSILKIKDKDVDIYKENILATVKRLKSFLPYTITIGIATIILKYMNNLLLRREAMMSIFNIFLFDMSGLSGYTINGPTWYLSAMLIIFFVEFPIIYINKKNYSKYIAPIITIFGLGYIYKSFGSLNIFLTGWNGFFYNGLIRALVDINLGIIIYEISESLRPKINGYGKTKKIILELIHISLYLFIGYFVLFYKDEGEIDYFAYVVIVVALLISFSETILSNLFDKKIVNYLERISLPIFINQFFFLDLLNIINESEAYSFSLMLLIYSVATIMFSIIEYHIINFIQLLLKKNKLCFGEKYEKKKIKY